MEQPSKHVMILAGEASGDLHGARLVEKLRQHDPSMRLSGMGLHRLREAGVELLVDASSIAVMGLLEVLRRWPTIRRALNTIEEAIERECPDVLVLIDYVEFNLRMAAVAKRAGVSVFFYISPQVWAWRPERVEKIGKLVDQMAVVFPFEVDIYQRAGVPVDYVGHPLSGRVHASTTRSEFILQLGIDEGKKIIGLLPGSRLQEVNALVPIMLDVAKQLISKHRDLHFVIPCAPSVDPGLIERQARAQGIQSLTALSGQAYDVMAHSTSIVIASGTATLEAAMIGAPMAIVYRVSPISWLWMKRKLIIQKVGLANIVAQEDVVPEFIQDDCRAELIAPEIDRQLTDSDYRNQMIEKLSRVNALLGDKDAASEVARCVFA
ncbi:MAG: lipid-A-disaccharide synthase, partial [Pseudomonadota bacterium]